MLGAAALHSSPLLPLPLPPTLRLASKCSSTSSDRALAAPMLARARSSGDVLRVMGATPRSSSDSCSSRWGQAKGKVHLPACLPCPQLPPAQYAAQRHISTVVSRQGATCHDARSSSAAASLVLASSSARSARSAAPASPGVGAAAAAMLWAGAGRRRRRQRRAPVGKPRKCCRRSCSGSSFRLVRRSLLSGRAVNKEWSVGSALPHLRRSLGRVRGNMRRDDEARRAARLF